MAALVSVNVGLPKDVAWNGRTVYTGVWKQPVTGRAWSAGSTWTATAKATLEPLEPPVPGNILLCCARPAEPIVVDL